ncbi:MAG: flagellar biosynthesis protein FliO [Rhodoferax sp.]|nr:flagellar biosynthesis protein FliO [Rhodoferax sp.]
MLSQTLLLVVVFVMLMAMLPWAIKWVQRRAAGGTTVAGLESRVISAVAVGPQQRVVTVEVGPEGARTWLVLGVTAQHINCLFTQPVGGQLPGDAASARPANLAQASLPETFTVEGAPRG